MAALPAPPESNGELPAILDLSIGSKLAFAQPTGRLRVGDSQETAMFLFPPPPKAEDIDSLPYSLGDAYSASGWEKGDEGFGIILYKDRVALALKTSIVPSEEEVLKVVADVEREAGKAPGRSILYDQVSYWFWRDGEQRMMVSSVEKKPGQYLVAMAMGHITVMDRLGMSEAKAQKDAQRAIELLRPRKNSQNSANRSGD